MESNKKISSVSRGLILVAGISLVVSLFVPIWGIDLDAPQYPEGLKLLINANGLAGDVDIVNGLNHYIGMKTLHNEDFIEFAILPYLIGFFALASFLVAIFSKPKWLNVLLISFLLFGVISMVDFWRWEYNYGHDLDPNAAIIVPGMAYQPPLIGFKQLLNFGAYSMPELGGYLFFGAGLLMLAAVYLERKKKKAIQTGVKAFLLLSLMGQACNTNQPKAIKLHVDNCHYCQMTIADTRFACELLNSKGRDYKFDDLTCLLKYLNENSKLQDAKIFVQDYLPPNQLIEVSQLHFIKGENIISPMSGNIAAFSSADSSKKYAEQWLAAPITWKALAQ